MPDQMDADDVHDVLDALRSIGIEAIVGGGWGIDALLGRQTRPHRDLDLAVPFERLDDAISALAALGYRPEVDQRPARVELRAGRRSVDVHPVEWDAAGHGAQHGLDGHVFTYPAESVKWIGSIGGRPVRCISPELQLAFHSGYELADRDRADVLAVAESFGLELPRGY